MLPRRLFLALSAATAAMFRPARAGRAEHEKLAEIMAALLVPPAAHPEPVDWASMACPPCPIVRKPCWTVIFYKGVYDDMRAEARAAAATAAEARPSAPGT